MHFYANGAVYVATNGMIKWIKCVIPRKEPLFQNEITRLKSWFFHSLLVFWVKELKWTHPVHTCSVIFNGMCKGRPSQNTTIIWKELLGQSMNTLAWISLQAGRQYLIHSDGRGQREQSKAWGSISEWRRLCLGENWKLGWRGGESKKKVVVRKIFLALSSGCWESVLGSYSNPTPTYIH